MYIEKKNICANLVGTLLNIEGKTKKKKKNKCISLALEDLKIQKRITFVTYRRKNCEATCDIYVDFKEQVKLCNSFKSVKLNFLMVLFQIYHNV